MTRVLVVDDESAIAEVVADILRGEGYEVDVAMNGALALEQMHASRPDVALIDMMMPIVDGLALLEAMRGDDSLRSVAAVLMSAAREIPTREKELGTPFLRKPFELDELLATIARALDRPKWATG